MMFSAIIADISPTQSKFVLIAIGILAFAMVASYARKQLSSQNRERNS